MQGQTSSSTKVFTARLVATGLLLGCLGVMGCEIRPKPFLHTVEYDSISSCREGSDHCSWKRSEREAEFSALVNCLLAGANVLEITEEQDQGQLPMRRVVAPVSPRFGYERGSNSPKIQTGVLEQAAPVPLSADMIGPLPGRAAERGTWTKVN